MKENSENFSENILQNIADDLSTINGTCTEIKESQLNCATADNLINMGTTIKSAVAEKYLADNFGTPTVKLQYKEYTNGASLTSEDATFAVSLVILTTSAEPLNSPTTCCSSAVSHQPTM